MSATNFYLGITSCTHTPSIPENKSPLKGLATLAIIIGGVLITKKLTSRVGKVSSACGTVGLIVTIWRQNFSPSAVNLTQAFSEIEQEVQGNLQKAPFAFHKLLRILYGREMNGPDLDQAKGCLSKVFDLLEPSIKEGIEKISSIDPDNLHRLCLVGVIPSFDGCTGLSQADETTLNLSKNAQKETIGKILDCLEQNDFNVRFEETKRCLESPDYDNHKKLFQLFVFITLSEDNSFLTTQGITLPDQSSINVDDMIHVDHRVQAAFYDGKFHELIEGKKIDFEEASRRIPEILTSVEVIKLFKEAQDQDRALHCSILCKLMVTGDHEDETFKPLQDYENSYLPTLAYSEEKGQEGSFFESNPLGYTAKNVISGVLELISNNSGKSFADIVADIGDGSSEY